MKNKGKPGSKMPTTKTNTNKNKQPETQNTGGKLNTSLLKKNEFALIVLGALLLTIIIFFLFFTMQFYNLLLDLLKVSAF